MNMKKIGIINSGVCNLFSLENLLSYLDIKFISSSDPNDLSSCSHLILPGVGAFDSGMTNLRKGIRCLHSRSSIERNPFTRNLFRDATSFQW